MQSSCRPRSILLALTALLLAVLACSLPTTAATSTPPAPATAAGGSVGGGSVTTTNDASPTPTATATSSATATPTATITPTATPTDTPRPDTAQGPYVVKQIETLGGETISGAVCKLTDPFIVTSTTPKVTFTFVFTPQAADHGKLTYAYSIPSAGESHNATGTYTIQPAGTDGTLLLAMTVSDHVTFKGFDGNIPLHYKFDLVPAVGLPCPGAD